MPRRLLVVITTEVPDAKLNELARHLAGDDAEVLVVAPASNISRLDWLTNAEDDARAEARVGCVNSVPALWTGGVAGGTGSRHARVGHALIKRGARLLWLSTAPRASVQRCARHAESDRLPVSVGQPPCAAPRIAACPAERHERAFRADRGNSAWVPSSRRTRSARRERG